MMETLQRLFIRSVVVLNLFLDYKNRFCFRLSIGCFTIMTPIILALQADVTDTCESLEVGWQKIYKRLERIRSAHSNGGIPVASTNHIGDPILRLRTASGREFTATVGLGTLMSLRTRLLRAEHDCVGAVIQMSGFALSFAKAESNGMIARRASLVGIFEREASPIFVYELCLWVVTRTLHCEEVLGDFRETFEMRSAKYGFELAQKWARRQTVREVWNKISFGAKIIGWATGAFHFFSKHFRK